MPLISFDYECEKCRTIEEHLVQQNSGVITETIYCPTCASELIRLHPAPAVFNTIIPTYPGSRARKAGYQHLYGNRPATKTQVGVGGGVSKGD